MAKVEKARADLAASQIAEKAALAARKAALDQREKAVRAAELQLQRDMKAYSIRKAELDAEASTVFRLTVTNKNLRGLERPDQERIIVAGLLRNLSQSLSSG